MDIGTKLQVDSQPFEIVGRLGSGGQGDVFEIASSTGNRRLALKWYHPHTATKARRRQIASLVSRGAPSDRFIWPIGLIDDLRSGRFGYVMELRSDNFEGVPALLSGRIRRDERSVVRLAFELAIAFRDLHLRGLCYRDVNLGNAFMDPVTGEARICDNDNVGVDGVDRAEVLGTPKFMAPEVVRGEALPSKYTDRYSLAVLIFYLLVVHHPLEGERTEQGLADADALATAYGHDPRFCFDPDDRSNRPVADLHPHVERQWAALPESVRRLFVQSFTDGLSSPEKRVVDSEWCHALADYWTTYVVCPSCQTSFTPQGRFESRHDSLTCPSGDHLDVGLLLTSERFSLPALEGLEVTSHHVNGDLDLDRRYATVELHPLDTSVCGLRIDHQHGADYRTAVGQHVRLEPGRRGRVESGARFSFGSGAPIIVDSV